MLVSKCIQRRMVFLQILILTNRAQEGLHVRVELRRIEAAEDTMYTTNIKRKSFRGFPVTHAHDTS